MDASEERALERWTRAGLITPDQRTAIEEFERSADRGPRALSALIEVLIYLGVAAAIGAIIAGLGRVWDDAAVGARIGLLAGAGAAAGVAGYAIGPGGGAPARAAAALQVVSVGLVASAAAVFTDDAGLLQTDGSGWHLAVIGAAATATAVIHHARRPGPLQLVVLGAAVATTAVGLVTIVTRPTPTQTALAVVAAGVATTAARARLQPAQTARWLGPAIVLAGLHLTAWMDGGGWAEAGGILVSIAVLAGSIPERSTGLLAVGSVGLFTFVPGVIVRHLADSVGAPVALFVAGMALIGSGVAIARIRERAVR